MIVHNGQGNTSSSGGGLVNTLINKLPVELHIPGYQFCGPGTKLNKRLARGDQGINPLDAACRKHDIAYRDHKSLEARHLADKELAERAWERVKSKDASVGEKSAAWAVTTAMKAKTKFGMGCKSMRSSTYRKKTTRKSRRKSVPFKGGILKKVINAIQNTDGGSNLKDIIKKALAVAKTVVKGVGGKRNVTVPRVLPLPKEGGFLPFLIPLFAGLSAAGALAGGASGIAKAVNDAKSAKQKLEEETRHNRSMEAIALGKQGSGLYMRKTKKGSALYLKPYDGGAMYLKPYNSKN